jgi:hypothetical protein
MHPGRVPEEDDKKPKEKSGASQQNSGPYRHEKIEYSKGYDEKQE